MENLSFIPETVETKIINLQDVEHVDYNVVRSNDLIVSSSKLSINEAKVIYTVIAQILKSDKLTYWYSFTTKQLQTLCNLNEGNIRRDLLKLKDSLMDKKFTIVETYKNAKGELKTREAEYHWLYGIKHDSNRWDIRLHNELMPFVLKLKDNFTSDKLKELTSYSSYSALRIHELLSMEFWKRTSKMSPVKVKNYTLRLNCKIDSLKAILGLADKYENRFYNFNERVLKPSKDEINQLGFFNVEYEIKKESQIPIEIVFFIKLGHKNDRINQLKEKESSAPLFSDEDISAMV